LKEKAYENKLRRWLNDNGVYVEKRHGSKYTGRGKPDFLCVDMVSNKFFEIEVKGDGGRLSPEQERYLSDRVRHTWTMFVSKPDTFESDKAHVLDLLAKWRV
jgi:hypothetical protein